MSKVDTVFTNGKSYSRLDLPTEMWKNKYRFSENSMCKIIEAAAKALIIESHDKKRKEFIAALDNFMSLTQVAHECFPTLRLVMVNISSTIRLSSSFDKLADNLSEWLTDVLSFYLEEDFS